MSQLETGIPSAATRAGFAPPLSQSLPTRLIQKLAPKVWALHAGGIILVHWLYQVPVLYTFIAGTFGLVLLFLVLGMIVNRSLLGFFTLAPRRISPDWLPILLILPSGISLFGCYALGLVDPQMQQQLSSGLASLQLMLIIAILLPLLLGRITAWPVADQLWQNMCEGLYVLTTFIAAIILFWLIGIALSNTAMSNNSSTKTGLDSTTPTIGFVCNPNTLPSNSNDEDEEDNKCTSTVTKHGAAKLGTTASTASIAAPPIKQVYLLVGSGLLLFGGIILIVGRSVSMHNAANVASSKNGMAAAIIPPTPVAEGVANTSANTHTVGADTVLTATPTSVSTSVPRTEATELALASAAENAEFKQLRESLFALQERMSINEQIVCQLQASTSILNNAHSLVSMQESQIATAPATISTTSMGTVAMTEPAIKTEPVSTMLSASGYQKRKYY